MGTRRVRIPDFEADGWRFVGCYFEFDDLSEAEAGSATPTTETNCPTCQLVDCYCGVAGSATPTQEAT
jgi:hypothetical protein